MAKEIPDEEHMITKVLGFAFLGVVVILGLVVFFGSWFIINSGERGVMLTWGKAGPVSIGPGLHFKIPIEQDVVKFDVRTQKFGADASADSFDSAASKDLQIVKAQIAVNYHVNPDNVAQLYSEVGANYEDTVITPAVHDAMKATTALYTAEELVTLREEVRDKIQGTLSEKLAQYHITVESVNIVKFDFSDQFNVAIENKVTAEQQKEKAVNDLERIKVEAEQKVATANGERDSAIAQAEGIAKTTQLTAEADAEKVRLINEQLQRTPQYIEYVKAQKWDGHLPISLGGSVQPFLNVAPLLSQSGSVDGAVYGNSTE